MNGGLPSVSFNLRLDTGERAKLRLTGWLGWEVDSKHPDTAGQVCMTTTGPLGEADRFENVIELQVPEARAIAAALIALADYVDRNEDKKPPP